MKRYLLLVLLLTFCPSLNGCVSLGGFWDPHEQNLSTQYDDAGIKTAITSSLLRENPTKANDIGVHCFQGHVFLVGEADAGFRALALETASQVEGVVHVTTHWFPSGTADTSTDSLLAREISEQMKFSSNPSSKVDVDVWGGHVVLTGLLSSQSEIDAAISLARRTSGVTSVTSYLSPL